MWMPERVWEQSLTSDLAEAGVRYTLLDDFHFKNAGLDEDELHGYYITEDDGKLLSVFPGSERLRYTIPFREPQETIDYLRPIAERQPGAVVVFGDDGEKFGSLAGHEGARLRPRLAAALLRCARREPQLAQRRDADRSARPGAAARQGLHPRRQLPRNDRVGAADRAAQGIQSISSTIGSTRAAGTKSRRSSAAATGGTSK